MERAANEEWLRWWKAQALWPAMAVQVSIAVIPLHPLILGTSKYLENDGDTGISISETTSQRKGRALHCPFVH